MIDRDTAQRRFEDFLEAMETYDGANSNEARAAAEEKALVARDALDKETGIIRLRQGRLAAEALGHVAPGTAPREADFFDRFIGDCLDTFETPSSRQRIRHLIARCFIDDEALLTPRLARLLAEKVLANAKGFLGALDPVEGSSGVDPKTGLAANIRTHIVIRAGYTVGVELEPDRRIPHELWRRAARAHSDLVQTGHASGHKIQGADAGTIKSWCQKKGPSADLFKQGRSKGAAERENPDPELML